MEKTGIRKHWQKKGRKSLIWFAYQGLAVGESYRLAGIDG
jgi:hypothetical protein